jgi:hypothetical protein
MVFHFTATTVFIVLGLACISWAFILLSKNRGDLSEFIQQWNLLFLLSSLSLGLFFMSILFHLSKTSFLPDTLATSLMIIAGWSSITTITIWLMGVHLAKKVSLEVDNTVSAIKDAWATNTPLSYRPLFNETERIKTTVSPLVD